MYQPIPNVTGIYLITNVVTGKVYVGSAQRMRSRLQVHRNQLRGGKHHSALLQHAWDKYGEHAFVASVIEECGVDEMRAREQAAIDAHGAADRARGYNLNPTTVPGRCMPHRKETKRKIGDANRGKTHVGVPMPEHVRVIMSRYWVRPTQQAIAAAHAASRGNKFHLGHKHSAEVRERMSAKTRGELHPKAKLTEEAVREIRGLRAAGLSGPAIARRYGVGHDSVYNILNGKTWRHVAEAMP